ncbi:VOC family protein [Paenibacillus timonensis]|uniref:VOC family protein n=1 Tax=Paenibacillus timonensis TaxID=225915 RepID=A0ABW3S648_9BACL|nr:VOC family protein [Paenibacillus timonensis]MCH1638569.1 VOC family protein [Paenibacillus timonensis]
MPIDAYLYFDGNCREAVDFYAQAFGVERPQILTFGEAHSAEPDYTLPEAAKDRVMHANLKVSGSNLMFSDVFPGSPYTVGTNISLALVSPNREEITAAFERLKEGGTVQMELQETFWSPCYGNVKDKYGIEWQLSYDDGRNGM